MMAPEGSGLGTKVDGEELEVRARAGQARVRVEVRAPRVLREGQERCAVPVAGVHGGIVAHPAPRPQAVGAMDATGARARH